MFISDGKKGYKEKCNSNRAMILIYNILSVTPCNRAVTFCYSVTAYFNNLLLQCNKNVTKCNSKCNSYMFDIQINNLFNCYIFKFVTKQ